MCVCASYRHAGWNPVNLQTLVNVRARGGLLCEQHERVIHADECVVRAVVLLKVWHVKRVLRSRNERTAPTLLELKLWHNKVTLAALDDVPRRLALRNVVP